MTAVYLNEATPPRLRGAAEMGLIRLGDLLETPRAQRAAVARRAEAARREAMAASEAAAAESEKARREQQEQRARRRRRGQRIGAVHAPGAQQQHNGAHKRGDGDGDERGCHAARKWPLPVPQARTRPRCARVSFARRDRLEQGRRRADPAGSHAALEQPAEVCS